MRQNGPQRFHPEVELLLRCARTQTLDTPNDCVTDFAFDDLDWDTVISLARRHRLQPFVNRSLAGHDISIPADVRTHLENTSETVLRRNLRMVSELVDLVARLEEAGVRVLPFKGPSLAALAYRDLGLRSFVDLDLLVPQEEFDKATEILCAGNYAVEASFPAFGEKTLREQDTDILVDLHFSVTPARYPFTFPFERFWQRRVEVPLGGRTFQTFSPSDLLQVLAVHGTRHFWIQLEWVVSFAALTQHESIDWKRVLRRSKQVGCDRMVLFGLRLSQELLGLSLPKNVSTIVADDRTVRLLCNRFISQVVRQDVSASQANRSFHLERYVAQLALMRGLRASGTYGMRLGRSLISNRLKL